MDVQLETIRENHARAGDVLSLIARLENERESSFLLDAEIRQMVGAEHISSDGHPCTLTYTASIDAAATLVPDNHGWSVTSDGTARVWNADKAFYGLHKNGDMNRKVPIALCIAALKARVPSR